MPVNVTINASGPDAEAVVTGLTIQFFDDLTAGGVPLDTGVACAAAITGTASDAYSFMSDPVGCTLDGTYLTEYGIGLDNLSPAWSTEADCSTSELTERITDGASPTFSVGQATIAVNCTINISASALLIDKVVVNDGGGTASATRWRVAPMSPTRPARPTTTPPSAA
jgi:hypothetical protein